MTPSLPTSPNAPPDSPEAVSFPWPMATVEGIPVVGVPSPPDLFQAFLTLCDAPGQRVVAYLNVHVANQAARNPLLQQFLQSSDLVYCDGAGVALGAKLLGEALPCRLTAADWILDLIQDLSEAGKRLYILGFSPETAEQVGPLLDTSLPGHGVVGIHHGYLRNPPELNDRVIAEINALAPDVLLVGMGTPVQEHWVARHRDQLNVSLIYVTGAVFDYHTGQVSRCPGWVGRAGFEWAWRLAVEPRRLFTRYVVGNPAFLARVLRQRLSRGSSRA